MPEDQFTRRAQILGGGFIVIVMVVNLVAAYTRGPWLDEFWSIWLGDPQVPFAEAFRTRMLADVHPPLFVVVARFLSEFGGHGHDLFFRRLLNLIPAGVLLAFFLYSLHSFASRRKLIFVCSVLTFSSYYMIEYFPEHRSYFSQFCFGIILFGSVSLLYLERGMGRRQYFIISAFLAAAILNLMNLHYLGALLTLPSLGVLTLFMILQRRTRLAWILASLTGFATACLILVLVVHGPYLAGKSGGHFWMRPMSLGEFLINIAVPVIKGAGWNIVAFLVALIAASAALIQFLLPGHRAFAAVQLTRVPVPDQEQLKLALALAAGSALSIACVLLVNIHSPVVIHRYLSVIGAASCCLCALLAERILCADRRLVSLFVANALVFALLTGFRTISEKRWAETAEFVAREQHSCSESQVYASRFAHDAEVENQDQVVDFALDFLRKDFGIKLSSRPPRDTLQAAVGGGCPVLFWLEGVRRERADLANLSAQEFVHIAGLPIDAAYLPFTTFRLTWSGAVVIVGNTRTDHSASR